MNQKSEFLKSFTRIKEVNFFPLEIGCMDEHNKDRANISITLILQYNW